jgi:hypothetical protein
VIRGLGYLCHMRFVYVCFLWLGVPDIRPPARPGVLSAPPVRGRATTQWRGLARHWALAPRLALAHAVKARGRDRALPPQLTLCELPPLEFDDDSGRSRRMVVIAPALELVARGGGAALSRVLRGGGASGSDAVAPAAASGQPGATPARCRRRCRWSFGLSAITARSLRRRAPNAAISNAPL